MNKKEVFKTLSKKFESTLEKPLNTNIITGKVLLGRPEEPPTQTEINDILWFECDEIYRYCGIYNAVYNEDDEDEDY